jgi:hypothetical protein
MREQSQRVLEDTEESLRMSRTKSVRS